VARHLIRPLLFGGLVLVAGCEVVVRATFDDRRPVASRERFGIVEARGGKVEEGTLSDGRMYRGLPVRLVRADSFSQWKTLAEGLSLQEIRGEIRSRRGDSLPLFAISAEQLRGNASRSVQSVKGRVEAETPSTPGGDTLALRVLERELLEIESTKELQRDFLLICVPAATAPDSCWGAGRRFLLRIIPTIGDPIEYPIWMERESKYVAPIVGTALIVFFLLYTTH